MKRFLSIILGLALIFSLLTACGRNKNNTSSKNENSSSSQSKAPSMAPTISPSPSMSPEVSGGDLNSGDPSSSLRPSEAQNRNLDEFSAALKKEFGADYTLDTVMDNNEIENLTGITMDMYDEIYGEKSSQNQNPDIFIAVKAKEDKKDEVKKKLEEYKAKMNGESSESANSNLNSLVQIMEQDNYVFLLGKNNLPEGTENMGDKLNEELKRAEEVIKNILS